MRSQRRPSLDYIYFEGMERHIYWKLGILQYWQKVLLSWQLSKDSTLFSVSSETYRWGVHGHPEWTVAASDASLPLSCAASRQGQRRQEVGGVEHHSGLALASDRSEFKSWFSHWVWLWLRCLPPLGTSFLIYKMEIILISHSLWKITWDDVWVHCLVFA